MSNDPKAIRTRVSFMHPAQFDTLVAASLGLSIAQFLSPPGAASHEDRIHTELIVEGRAIDVFIYGQIQENFSPERMVLLYLVEEGTLYLALSTTVDSGYRSWRMAQASIRLNGQPMQIENALVLFQDFRGA